MLNKERLPAGLYAQGIPSCHFIEAGRKSLDLACLEKIGADVSFQFKEIAPRRGYGYLHMITLGAGEFYGQNANTDFFNETFRRWNFPHPVNSMQKSASLDGGLKKYHNVTYLESGAVYIEHNNGRRGAKPEGDIVAAAYNDGMHRGELIIGVPLNKWASDVDGLANGIPIYWSMGSSVKEDICSYCGNRRRKLPNSCEHLRFYKHAIDENGDPVFAINDAPHFHDISKVRKPADRIAFTLCKIASEDGPVYEDDDAELYLPMSFVKGMQAGYKASRVDILNKLAAMEKKLDAECSGCGNMNCPACGQGAIMNNLPEEMEDSVDSACEGIPADSLMRGMSDNKMMMSPKQFVRIIVKKDPESAELSDLPEALSSVFSDMKENASPEEIEDGTDIPSGKALSSAQSNQLKTALPVLSTSPDDVANKVIRVIIIKGGANDLPMKAAPKSKHMKKKASECSRLSRYVAREYAKYQLGFLAEHPDTSILSYCTAMNRI